MLVLTRKPKQVVRIGQDIYVEVLSVNGENVKLGIVAPAEVAILREEVYQSVGAQNREAVARAAETNPLTFLKTAQLSLKQEKTQD